MLMTLYSVVEAKMRAEDAAINSQRFIDKILYYVVLIGLWVIINTPCRALILAS